MRQEYTEIQSYMASILLDSIRVEANFYIKISLDILRKKMQISYENLR